MRATLYFDGACSGNPGPSAGAAVITLASGERIKKSWFIAHATCNESEYMGLIVGLGVALGLGVTKIHVYGDSMLVVNQTGRRWRTRNVRMRHLCSITRGLLSEFQSWNISHIPRKLNGEADAVARRCRQEHAPASVMKQDERTT